MSNSKHKKPWQYPDCPTCNSEIYVTHMVDDNYKCEFCGDVFTHGEGEDAVIQPPHLKGHDNGGGENIDPPTDKEIMQIYDDADKFVVATNFSQKGARQHLHDDGDKLCSDHVQTDGTRIVDSAVYPPGYNKLCKLCVKQWRA